jgi:hypothetical protein
MPLSTKHSEPIDSLPDYIDDQTDMTHIETPEGNAEEKQKSKQQKRTQVMQDWLEERDTYLHEMLRHDGREGQLETSCRDCGKTGDFSCFNCAYALHYCQGCIVRRHRLMPFHRIRVS